MVVKADQERIKTLLRDTITLLCKNGLHFKTEFSVEALIGITLDREDVVLISISEIIRTEHSTKLALTKDVVKPIQVDNGENSDGDSHPSSPMSPNSQRQRKRKHSPLRKTPPVDDDEDDEDDDGDDDESDGNEGNFSREELHSNRGNINTSLYPEESNSEPPPLKRTSGEVHPSNRPIKGEHEEDNDVVYIKEELDMGEWPGGSRGPPDMYHNIPHSSSNMSQSTDNFDFLQGSSLVPMSEGQGAPWSDVSQPPPLSLISPPKRTATVTTNSPSTPTDQQTKHKRRKGKKSKACEDELLDLRLSMPVSESKSRVTVEQVPQASIIGHHLTAQSDVFVDDLQLGSGDLEVKEEVDCVPFDNDVPVVASNVEVQNVNSFPLDPLESQSEGSDFYGGIRLPARKEFCDPNFKSKCPEMMCGKSFSTYQGFIRHIDQHRGRFPYACSICNRGFMTKDHMGNHMRGHTGERLYCFCGSAFKTHQALRMHKKREHQDFSVTYDGDNSILLP